MLTPKNGNRIKATTTYYSPEGFSQVKKTYVGTIVDASDWEADSWLVEFDNGKRATFHKDQVTALLIDLF